jgi:hypothetical protein
MSEIYEHVKEKEKNGYGKQYHFLVVVQVSIFYMENML